MVRLPVEYQEVEYLESSGTQYFLTDVDIQDGLTVDSMQTFAQGSDSYLFGGQGDSATNSKTCFNGNFNVRIQGAYPTSYYLIGTLETDNQTKYHVVSTHANNKRICVVNDVEILRNSASAFDATTGKCLCFGWNKYGTPSHLYKGKVYFIKVSKADTILANFIPCYRKSDSEPGMYDTVTKQFFTNAGTGTFLVGNDVSWDTASLIERRRQILLNTPHLTTASANPLTFQTDISAPIKDCKIYFEPVQDLHGYDKPYPAGGGVNAIPYAVAKTETVGGLTFSTDGKGTYTVTGTPTDIGYVYFDLIEPFTIPDGATNKFHFLNNIAASQIQVAFINIGSIVDTWSVNPAKRSANYSRMSNKPCTRIRIGCTNLNNTNPIDLTLKLMIVPNETIVTDYIPYENICPITGWDGVTVTRCGKNLFDYYSRLSNHYLDTVTGEPVAQNGYYITPFIKVLANVPVHFPNSGSARRWFYDKNKIAKTYLKNSSGQTFTPTEDGYIRVTVSGTNSNASKYQIEYGSEATDYEPYTGTSLTIPFPQTIYGGYVDLVKGEVVETWVGFTFDGVNYKANSDYTGNGDKQYIKAYWVYWSPRATNPSKAVSVMCDKLPITRNHNTGYISSTPRLYAAGNGALFGGLILGTKEDYPDLAEATSAERISAVNAWFTENPTTVVYSKSEYDTKTTYQLADGLTHVTLGQDISPRPNDRSSTGGYANSTATGIDGCKFVYFELGWPTEAFLQYSADISRKSEFVSDSRVLINGTTTDAKLGEMVLSTGSATDYEGDALVYLYVSVPSDCTDLESKRAYLAEHPIKITYPKKTPIPYTVDLTDLKPVKGTNNIWSNGNGNIEIKFWKH